MTTALTCHHCHHSWPVSPPITRSEECPSCRRDAKVCLNCRFYQANAYRECQESQAGWIKDKEKGNFCDYFEAGQGSAPGSAKDSAAKADLEALFGSGGKDQGPAATGQNLADELANFLKNKK